MAYKGSGCTPNQMHKKLKNTIAAFMFHGGSLGRRPESFWKNTNHGNLMPACKNTPADAANRQNHVNAMPSSKAA